MSCCMIDDFLFTAILSLPHYISASVCCEPGYRLDLAPFRHLLFKRVGQNISTLDEIFPHTYREQIKKYNGQFSCRPKVLEVDWFEHALNKSHCTPLSKGKHSEVYRYDDGSRFQAAIKRIVYDNTRRGEEDKASAYSELLAGSLRHYAIVPLIAWAEDKGTTQSSGFVMQGVKRMAGCIAKRTLNLEHQSSVYLMFPYMDEQDLRRLIDKDNELIKGNEELVLPGWCGRLIDENNELSGGNGKLVLPGWRRLIILLQVACCMAYLHKEVPRARGAMSHGDVTSSNVLLDESLDARLADFGESREYDSGQVGMESLSDVPTGTPGYYDESRTDYLNLETDIRYFGLVILEMLTGCSPMSDGQKPIDIIRGNYSDRIEAVWSPLCNKQANLVNELFALAQKCRNGQIDSLDVKKKLERLSREVRIYCRPKRNFTCKNCLITKKVDDDIEKGYCTRLQVCINCIRNWRINPIECHDCLEETDSPIAQNWGAVLLCGHDSDKAKFTRDVKGLSKVVTALHPMSIGIRQEYIFITNSVDELENTVKALQDSNIDTLFVYYTGHYGEKCFNFTTRGLTDDELRRHINTTNCSKAICIFDCCNGPHVTKECTHPRPIVIQLTACVPNQETDVGSTYPYSIFTYYLIQALQGKECAKAEKKEGEQVEGSGRCQICRSFKSSDDGYVSLEKLRTYMYKHLSKDPEQKEKVEPSTRCSWYGRDKDFNVAFMNVAPKHISVHILYEDSGTQQALHLDEFPDDINTVRDKAYFEIQGKEDVACGYSEILQMYTSYSDSKSLELETFEQIENAHGMEMDIFIKKRSLKNLHNGKVGIVLEEKNADTLFAELKTRHAELKREQPNFELYHLSEPNRQESLKPSQVNINLHDRGLWKMEKLVKNDEMLAPLRRCLEQIRESRINKEEGILVLSFPVGLEDDETVVMNKSFFTIHWERR